jgi:outer membrane receptor protein involved in Fe transport
VSSRLDLDRNYINPKIGLLWSPFPNTVFRAAWFKYVRSPLVSGQTIEPTQVAGFNQFYDDPDDTRAERYGIGLDQVLLPRLRAGLEFSWRDLDIPVFVSGTNPHIEPLRQEEEAHRVYAYWIPNDQVGLTAEYLFESFDRSPPGVAPTQSVQIILHQFPLTVTYHHPNGLFARLATTYVDQQVETSSFTDAGFQKSVSGERFWMLDATVGFRLPKRWGIATFGVRNLLDESLNFQDINFNVGGEPVPPLFVPERVFFGQLTLAF